MAKRLERIDLSTGPKSVSDPHRVELGAPATFMVVRKLPDDVEFREGGSGEFVPLSEGDAWDFCHDPPELLEFTFEKGSGEAVLLLSGAGDPVVDPNGGGGGGAGAAAAREPFALSILNGIRQTPPAIEIHRQSGWTANVSADAEFEAAPANYFGNGDPGGLVLNAPPSANDGQSVDAKLKAALMPALVLNAHGVKIHGTEAYAYFRTLARVDYDNTSGGGQLAMIAVGESRTNGWVGFRWDTGLAGDNWYAEAREAIDGGGGSFILTEELQGFDATEVHLLELRIGRDPDPYVAWLVDGVEAHRATSLASNWWKRTTGGLQNILQNVIRGTGTGNSTDYVRLWTHMDGTFETGRWIA